MNGNPPASLSPEQESLPKIRSSKDVRECRRRFCQAWQEPISNSEIKPYSNDLLAAVDWALEEIERLTREREIVTAAMMARVPNAPPVVEALQQFVRQWNACGPNSDFGRYFGRIRDVAVDALVKYQVAQSEPPPRPRKRGVTDMGRA